MSHRRNTIMMLPCNVVSSTESGSRYNVVMVSVRGLPGVIIITLASVRRSLQRSTDPGPARSRSGVTSATINGPDHVIGSLVVWEEIISIILLVRIIYQSMLYIFFF